MNEESAPKGAPQSTATTTSPILPPSTDLATIITLADAERLTTRIQLRLGTIADNVESVLPLIEQAKASNVHEVLGFRSWTEYVAERFGGTLTRISKAERIPIVELLSGQGMSTRAIATVVGVSQPQVVRDRQVIPGVSPEIRVDGPDVALAETITAVDPAGFFTDEAEMRDAFVMADATPDEFEVALAEAKTDGDMSRENVVSNIAAIKKIATRNVTGIDGKSYPASPVGSPTSRRRPLLDSYRDAAQKTLKSIGSLSCWQQDDRFTSNRETLKKYGPELARAANELVDLLDDLGIDRHKHGGIR